MSLVYLPKYFSKINFLLPFLFLVKIVDKQLKYFFYLQNHYVGIQFIICLIYL